MIIIMKDESECKKMYKKLKRYIKEEEIKIRLLNDNIE